MTFVLASTLAASLGTAPVSARWLYLLLFAINLGVMIRFGPTLSRLEQHSVSDRPTRSNHVL